MQEAYQFVGEWAVVLDNTAVGQLRMKVYFWWHSWHARILLQRTVHHISI